MNEFIQSVIGGVNMGVIYALVTLGLSIVFGVMNLTNFAHGDFVMVSMYLSYVFGTFLVWDAVFTPLVTAPLMFIFSLITYYLLLANTLRQYFVIQLAITVGLQIILRAVVLILSGASPRALQYSIIHGNIQIGGVMILTSRLVAMLISLLVIIAVAIFMNKTWTGSAMRAAADDLDTASLMGVNTKRLYALTFSIGSALIAISGGLLMAFTQIDPYGGIRFGLLSYCVLALAGLGSIPGLIVAGIIAGLGESLAVTYIDPRSRLLAIYLIFIVILWVKPKGLFGRK